MRFSYVTGLKFIDLSFGSIFPGPLVMFSDGFLFGNVVFVMLLRVVGF